MFVIQRVPIGVFCIHSKKDLRYIMRRPKERERKKRGGIGFLSIPLGSPPELPSMIGLFSHGGGGEGQNFLESSYLLNH